MDNLSLLMYAEIDIFCIIFLLYATLKSLNKVERRESWRFFQWSIVFITLFTLSDLLWELMENNVLPKTMFSAYMVNCCYFMFCVAGTAAWFFYTESELETRLINRRCFAVFVYGPLFITMLVLFINFFNGCMFHIDDKGIYHRGPLNILSFIIPCFYLVFSLVHSLSRALRKENYAKRRNYLNLTGFALTTTIPSALQVFIPGTPLPCIGLTAAVLLIYMSSQEMMVSIDPLTKLNNRYQMIRYLSQKMEHASEKNALYLLIIDMDYFKQINDTYGHVEGDAALVKMASVLRKTAGAFDCFVSRYGGDEFIIIHETDEEEDVEIMCSFIHKELETVNRLSDKGYALRVSIGKARYQREIKYMQEFIALADEALYQVKRERDKKQ